MINEAIKLLQHKITVSSASADNEEYQISMSIREAKELIALLGPKPEPGEIFCKECAGYVSAKAEIERLKAKIKEYDLREFTKKAVR